MLRCVSCVATLFVLASLAVCQAADGFLTRTGLARAQLELPAALRARIEANTGHTGRPLGYGYEQMLGFPTFEYRLRVVENLFRDVMHPVEYGGLIGDNLLAESGTTAQITYMLWSQLDARAGRMWEVPAKSDDWGVAYIPPRTDPTQAFRRALTGGAVPAKLSAKQAAALRLGGEPAVRLLARLLVAARLAAPFLRDSLDPKVLDPATTRRTAYELLTSPYIGDVNDDTILVADRRAYDAMRTWDSNRSAFGSALFLRHFDAALDEFRKTPGLREPVAIFGPVEFKTELGSVWLSGSGGQTHGMGGVLTLDLGGDDLYTGLIGAPESPSRPLSLVVDLEGQDRYDGRSRDGNIGCGLFGLGMVADLAGNDRYEVTNGGLGFGLYGTGLLVDGGGDDTYVAAKGWAQGAAYAGVGLLLDRAGNDSYRTICMSMGFGGTRGVGALVDVAGNDTYFTADTGNDSKAWGKTVSMCLGVGYGRRCDSGDGQNQGGGIGLVVEGSGNDTYHTSIFTLGSGYWWGAGIFEERGGDDVYRCTHYSMGSGAHFAVGSFVDLQGNDRYNDRPDALERWAAIGRDGAIAVCVDAAGDDVWGNLTGGHADLNSVALFWEVSGNDVYKRMQLFDPQAVGNRPFGSAVPYPPMRNFRDRMLSAGVFLDTGGKDTYPQGMTAAENSEWRLFTGPLFWGYGLDEG